MMRFGFEIRTRSGQRIDNISIVAATRDVAERRLRQMYRQCEIVACNARAVRHPGESRHDAASSARTGATATVLPFAADAVARLREKAGVR
jgi:hypothetical protein